MTFQEKIEKEFKVVEKIEKKQLKQKEKDCFTFEDGRVLGENAALTREYLRLTYKLAYGDFFLVPSKSLDKVKEILMELDGYIDNSFVSTKVVKQIIVIMDMLLNVSISYHTSLYELSERFNAKEVVELISKNDLDVIYEILLKENVNDVNI